MRPIGIIPQWPEGVAPPNTQFAPGDNYHLWGNYPFGEYRKWLDYHDCREVINWSKSYTLNATVPGDLWRKNHIAESQGLFWIGAQSNSDPTHAGLYWSEDGVHWSEDTSVAHGVGTSTSNFYEVTAGTGQRYLAWLTELGNVVTTICRFFFKTTYPLSPFPDTGWVEAFPTAGTVVESCAYDSEEDTWYAAGWNISFGHAQVTFFRDDGSVSYWIHSPEYPGVQLRHVAVSQGNKVVAGENDLFWAQGQLSTWRHYNVADIFPGSGLLKGLSYSNTDGVFVAVCQTAVWTSPNGVLWSKMMTNVKGSFLGPVTSWGGNIVIPCYVGTPGLTSHAFAITRNAGRDIFFIPSPVSYHADTEVSGVTSIRNVANRLVVLNKNNPLGLRYSLG